MEDDDEFECQVLPSPGGLGDDSLRSKAFVNVLGKNCLIFLHFYSFIKFFRFVVPPTDVSFDGPQRQRIEAKAEEFLDVTCRANGAKPAARLQWYRNGQLLSGIFLSAFSLQTLQYIFSDKNLQTREISEDEKRFTTTSRLRLKVTAKDNEAIFTCKADHPALLASVPIQNQFTLSVICKFFNFKSDFYFDFFYF